MSLNFVIVSVDVLRSISAFETVGTQNKKVRFQLSRSKNSGTFILYQTHLLVAVYLFYFSSIRFASLSYKAYPETEILLVSG